MIYSILIFAAYLAILVEPPVVQPEYPYSDVSEGSYQDHTQQDFSYWNVAVHPLRELAKPCPELNISIGMTSGIYFVTKYRL